MSTSSLSLSNIVPITIVVSPAAVPGLTFNQGLFVGPTAVIPQSERVRQYTSVADMITDGFLSNSPETLAAQDYFGQTPAPPKVWIGRQDLTAILTVTLGASGGTGYAVGDLLTVTQGGASGGTLKVTTVSTGVVTGVSVVQGQQGTGYTTGTNLATTTTGSGTGCEIDITAVGESALQAVTACRLATPAWYACMFVGTQVDADVLAIAAFIEAATPYSLFFYTTSDANVLNNVANNLMAQLQTLNYRRTFGVYSTTQSGAFPNNIYASASAMGAALGLNSGAPGSYWTIMYRLMTGIGAEPLTQTQVNTIAGSADRSSPGLNGNVFVTFDNGAFQWMMNGTMAGGAFLDQVVNLDMLATNIQLSVVNLLVSLPSVPITEPGMSMVKNVITGACLTSQQIGFIAPSGTWDLATIGTGNTAIVNGQSLPAGFKLYSPSVASLSQQARGARQLPPVTVAIIQAEAGQSLSVSIVVQQ